MVVVIELFAIIISFLGGLFALAVVSPSWMWALQWSLSAAIIVCMVAGQFFKSSES